METLLLLTKQMKKLGILIICLIWIGIGNVFAEPQKFTASWEPNPEEDKVMGYSLYWRFDRHKTDKIDYQGKPASLNNPYGVYIWQDSDDKEWHLWTTYAPNGFKDSYKITTVFAVGGRITQASYYSPESLEGINWDSYHIFVKDMSVNGTGGIDGIDFLTKAIELEFFIAFTGIIRPENIFIGKNRVQPKALLFSLGQGTGYSNLRKINAAALIPPEAYKDYAFMLDTAEEAKIYFALTAVNEAGESAFGEEVMIDLNIPEPTPDPDKEKPGHPIDFKLKR